MFLIKLFFKQNIYCSVLNTDFSKVVSAEEVKDLEVKEKMKNSEFCLNKKKV